MKKILYTGIEWFGLTHGGEYEVVEELKFRDKLLGVKVKCDDGEVRTISPYEFTSAE